MSEELMENGELRVDNGGSAWREVALGDLLTFGNGKRKPSTKGDIPIYGGNGVLGFTSDSNYQDETIIIGRVGAYCGSVYYETQPIWISDNALSAKPKNDYNSKFLYYFLRQLDLNQYAGGSSHPLVTQTLLNSLEFDVCTNPNEQKAIAEVLSALDDKIDLLHRQNKTLEQMAETLFRQWFVVEAGEDWEEVELKEICTISNGYAFKSPTYQEEGQKIIRTLNFSNHLIELDNLVFISHELAKNFSKYQLRRNDFLLVMVGASLGNFSIVTNDILPALQNQNMWCFRAKNNVGQNFLNFALRKLVRDNLHGASGSARQFFQKGVFYETPILCPPLEKINEFDAIVGNHFNKIELNRSQLTALQSLRDTLLPKLMSGEVRVQYDKEEK